MASKLKLKLRKDLDKLHPTAKGWSRQDLTSGRWFPKFVEVTLASHLGGRTPPELKERFPEADDEDELVEEVTNEAIHAAIAATDAYVESLTGTEVRNLKDRKLGGPPVKLTGDAVALVAELLYVMRLYIDLLFDAASAYGKVFDGGNLRLVAEVFGRSLGHFDVDEVKDQDDFVAQIGAKIYERAVIQTVDSKVSDALRKGFYCFLGKAIGQTMADFLDDLEDWTPPQAETGPMLAADDEADAGFQT